MGFSFISNTLMNKVFQPRFATCGLKSQTDFQIKRVINKDFEIRSIKGFDNKVLDIAPNEIRQYHNLNIETMGVSRQVNLGFAKRAY